MKMNRRSKRRKGRQAKQGVTLEPKGKESGCGSILAATSNEHSILGVQMIPKTSKYYPLY
jgi:hypothetical protein